MKRESFVRIASRRGFRSRRVKHPAMWRRMNLRSLVLCVTFTIALSLTAAAEKPHSSGPDPDAILRDLYKAHDAQKGPFFDRKNHKLLEKYLTKELATLLQKDASVSEGEVGAIEFDPLYASQDPQVTNFRIGRVRWGDIQKRGDNVPDKGFALVTVSFKENGKPRELQFRFEQEPDKTWRISDIHYPDGSSLLQLLRQAYPE